MTDDIVARALVRLARALADVGAAACQEGVDCLVAGILITPPDFAHAHHAIGQPIDLIYVE